MPNRNEVSVQVLEVGQLEVNCALISCGEEVVVIDPGADAEAILDAIGHKTLAAILLTHAHFDHIGAVNELRETHSGCRLLCHSDCDRFCRSPGDNFSLLIASVPYTVQGEAEFIEDGQEFSVGGLSFRAYLVPGHMDGQLCFYNEASQTLFCGDTVFAGSIGRSDFPGGNGPVLVKKILQMLRSLPGDTKLWPGHGPATRIDHELASNPYLRNA